MLSQTQTTFDVITGRLADRFWGDRVADMLRHVEITHGRPGGDNRKSPIVKAVRVAKNWPVSGSIFVERADGARFRFYESGGKFRIERR